MGVASQGEVVKGALLSCMTTGGLPQDSFVPTEAA